MRDDGQIWDEEQYSGSIRGMNLMGEGERQNKEGQTWDSN